MTIATHWPPSGGTWTDPTPFTSRAGRVHALTVVVRRTGKNLWSSLTRPAWVNPVIKRLGNAVTLNSDWDGAGARPTSMAAAEAALTVLFETMSDDSVPPQLVPTPDGGIQLEWHCAGVDLEVYIESDGKVSAWCREGSREWEEDYYPRARLTKELTLLTGAYCD